MNKNNLNVMICKDVNEVATEAARIISEQVKNNSKSILGLATGSTPVITYEKLIQDHLENGTSYKDIVTFNLDEYVGLDGSHPQSYRYFMEEHFFSKVDIKTENTNVPNGIGNVNENALAYENKLRSFGQVDIQLLGIGTNAHIAFNEPPADFNAITHVAELNESTRKDNERFFNNLEEVPTHAISMGIKTVMSAKKILLLAIGEQKADAINKMINGDITVDVPASILQNHNDVTIILDDAAAKFIK